MTPDFGTCLSCRRPFRSIARPRYAFDEEGNVLGRVHSGAICRKWEGTPQIADTYAGTDLLDAAAQFYLVRIEPREKHVVGKHPALFARHLLGEGKERHAELLDWWKRGPLALDVATLERIATEYDALVGRFSRWYAARSVAA